MAGFYRLLIINFSLKAKAVTDLTKDGILWQWGDNEEKSFCIIKRSLVLAPVLHMPNLELPFVVAANPNLVSVGRIWNKILGMECNRQPMKAEN